jgi:hypothetical protein
MKEELRVKDRYIKGLEEEGRGSSWRVAELEAEVRQVKAECVEALAAKERVSTAK